VATASAQRKFSLGSACAWPGAVLRERFLEPLGLTSGQVARAIGVLPDAVLRLSQEEMRLSAKMAVRLGRYFGTSAEYWAKLQMQHDLAVAARELTCDLRKIAPLARALIYS
jgi:antitoxin HigA-1